MAQVYWEIMTSSIGIECNLSLNQSTSNQTSIIAITTSNLPDRPPIKEYESITYKQCSLILAA